MNPDPSRASTAWMTLAAVGVMVGLTGCATLPAVQPWEKGALARPEMALERDRLDAAFMDHTYFSKEGVSGGATVGGGGCGCN